MVIGSVDKVSKLQLLPEFKERLQETKLKVLAVLSDVEVQFNAKSPIKQPATYLNNRQKNLVSNILGK